jgi:uncharacterized protein involved in outer membrane biogenesis
MPPIRSATGDSATKDCEKRVLARLFVLIGGLIVLALTAALIGPYFIDWSSYRADFEREASAVLGRKVTVQGAATARLLPFPSVTFSDVSVAGGPDGAPAMTVETFSMDAELAPFMRGEFLIFDMRLVRPRMTVSVGKDGVVDWTLRPSTPMDPGHISVEKLTVTEGKVTVRHAAGGRDHTVSEINAIVSARSLAGPWRGDGSLRIDGMKTAVSLSTGKVEDDGSMRLRIRADPERYPLAIETDGDVRFVAGAPRYAGAFRIDAEKPGGDRLRGSDGETFEVRQTGAGKPEQKTEPPYRLTGKFAFDHLRTDVQEFRFETGPKDNPYIANGSAMVVFAPTPRFSIEADGAQVRFDETIADPKAASGLTLGGRLAALEGMLADLPRPGIPGTIDVNLPAIVAGDTTIRDIKLSAEPASTGWSIKSFSATLPGRATLEGEGLLATDEDFGFKGSLLLAIAQPSGFAAWLSHDVDDAIRRLPAAGFSAKVDVTRKWQKLDDLELILGAAKFHGALDRRQPDDAEPSMTLKLHGGALDIDGLSAFASLFVGDKGVTPLAGQDLDLAVKAGPVTAGGLKADTVDTALRLRGGHLEIDRLSIGGIDGATVSATGTVRDYATRPSGNLDASIVAVDLAPLVATLAQRYPDNLFVSELHNRVAAYPALLGDAQVNLVATAAHDDDGTSDLAVSANGTAGGSAFSLTLSGGMTPWLDPDAPMSVTFNARNDNAEALMALYGLPVLPLGVIGGGDMAVSASGTTAKGLDVSLEFTSEALTASYKGTLRLGEEGPEGEGAAALEASDIEPWLMTGGIVLPGMGMGMETALKADASFGNGLASFSKIAGSINEGSFGGDINVGMKNGLPHVTGAVAVDSLDLWAVTAMILGESALQGDGQGWPKAPFQGKARAPLTADIDITAGTFSAGVFGAGEALMATARLDGEGLRVADFSAKAFGGTLTGLGELKNNGGTGLVSAQMKLNGADLGAVFEGTGIVGKGDITANLSASGKSAEGLISALSGSGTLAFGGTSIPGVDAHAFPAIIARADAIGRDIDAKATAQFAPRLVGNGTFAAASGELAFTVAGGVVRAPQLTLAGPAATLTANLKADLGAETVSADGEIQYAPGDDALVGSEPVVRYAVHGPLGAMEGRYDTAPLAQFLTQRALEIEEARVEAMQAALLEKQRLRREVQYYASLEADRQAAAEAQRLAEAEEARRLAAETRRVEEERARAEEEVRAKAAQDAAQAAEAAEKVQQEAEANKPEPAPEPAPTPDVKTVPVPTDRGAGNAAPAPAPQSGGGSTSFDENAIGRFLKSLRGEN